MRDNMTRNNSIEHFLLLGTEGCHLCDIAEQVLVSSLSSDKHSVDYVDIAYDDQLLERYGEKIPVFLHEASGEALCWPFGETELNSFLEGV
jgi:hypothetical protein